MQLSGDRFHAPAVSHFTLEVLPEQLIRCRYCCDRRHHRRTSRRERQSSHCMSQLHFWREPDEKLEGSFFLTSTRQKSILRGSEIFGYDEKEYPERMLQRAAGWCKAVQGICGKILSELSG